MGCGRYYERFVRLRDMRWASEESRSVARAAKDFSGACSGHFASVDYRNAVDQHIVHSLRKLIGIVEGGEIADRSGIENRDIRPHAHAQKAAALGRKRCEGSAENLRMASSSVSLWSSRTYLRRMRGKVP